MKIIKNSLIAIGSVLLALILLLSIWGGGFGQKSDELPARILLRKTPLLIAHRGATENAAENSLSAFIDARRKAYPAVEIDVQRSKDGYFFLFHDETTERLLGYDGIASELDSSRLRSSTILYQGQPSGDSVLLLDDFFGRFRHDFIVYLDFKRFHQRNYVKMAQELNDLLARYKLFDSVIIGNGNVVFVAYLEYNYPQVMTCLEGFFPDARYFYNLIPKFFRPDFISGFDYRVDESFSEWLDANDMTHRAIVYHVTEKNFNQMLKSGINNLIARDGDYLDSYLK